MTTAPPAAQPDLAPPDAAGFWAQAWGGTESYTLAREAMEAWACAYMAWADYLSRLTTSAGPVAMLDAGARLMTDSLEICSRAAAARLAEGGVAAPLLNDA